MGLPPWMNGGREQYMLGTGQWVTPGNQPVGESGRPADEALLEGGLPAQPADPPAPDVPANESFQELVARLRCESAEAATTREQARIAAQQQAASVATAREEIAELARGVAKLLSESQLDEDRRVLGGGYDGGYSRLTQGSNNPFSRGRRKRYLRKYSIGAWSTGIELNFGYETRDGPSTKKNAVWLGSDGRLYLPSGVTNVEIEVGVTPAPPLEVGFLDAGQLKAVREGLANLIVAHGLDWSGAAAGPG